MKGRARSALSGERLLAHNLVVVGGSVTAGVLGFAFQALISHRLRPSDYGAAFAAMTLLTFIALPATALTLLMARETSRDRAAGHIASSAALLRAGSNYLLFCGLALTILMVAASPWLATYLEIPNAFLLAVAASMPVALALPFLLGELQGEQRFLSFSSLSVGQAGLKLLAAITLGAALGPVGIVLGLAVASTFVYGVALVLVRRKLAIRVRVAWLRPSLRYLALAVPSTLALSVLLSTDILLVKHFFKPAVAGEYAAVAALGRAIFWVAAGVAIVLFPKITFRETQGQSAFRIVAFSLALVASGGAVGLLLLSFAARPILTAFAGNAYSGGAGYLPLYAVGMTLLGCASVLIATHQSRARALFLVVLLPITVLEPVIIVAFHRSLMQVVQVVDLTMVGLVVGLGLLLLVRQPKVARRDAASFVPAVAVAEVQA